MSTYLNSDICANCGERFGLHRSTDNLCPRFPFMYGLGHWGGEKYFKKARGLEPEVSTFTHGHRAAIPVPNLVGEEALPSPSSPSRDATPGHVSEAGGPEAAGSRSPAQLHGPAKSEIGVSPVCESSLSSAAPEVRPSGSAAKVANAELASFFADDADYKAGAHVERAISTALTEERAKILADIQQGQANYDALALELTAEREKCARLNTQFNLMLAEAGKATSTLTTQINSLRLQLQHAEERAEKAERETQRRFTAETWELTQERMVLKSQLDAAEKRLAEVQKQLAAMAGVISFSKTRATHCAKCGVFKHTPWRDDEYGYVCASCFDAIKNEQLAEQSALALRLREAIEKTQPNEGAWENKCYLCGATTEVGSIPHSARCPVSIVRSLTPSAALLEHDMALAEKAFKDGFNNGFTAGLNDCPEDKNNAGRPAKPASRSGNEYRTP